MSSRSQRHRKCKVEQILSENELSESDDDDDDDDDDDEEEEEESGRVTPNGKNFSSDDEDVPLSKRKRTRNPSKSSNSSDEDDSDSDSPPKKRHKLNSGRELKNKTKAKGRKTTVDDDLSDSSDDGGKFRASAGARKRKRRRKKSEETSDGDFVSQAGRSAGQGRGRWRESTGRVRTHVKYDDALSDGEFDDIVTIKEDEEDEDLEEVDIDAIEKVMDHRQGKVGATGEMTKYFAVKENGDPNLSLETTQLETQFLIKWKDKAHINNTWETEQTLEERKVGKVKVKGLMKVNNYLNKVTQYEAWKKRANPEDVEFCEIDIELGRDLFKTHFEVERIFCRRKNDEDQIEFYVKWRNLAYSEATWEAESLIKTHYLADYERFKRRKKARTEPKDYRSSMRGVKVKFSPMKKQPDYIGSGSLRLRDYQLDGISFLLSAWCRGNSVILADEMGLGKTIQTVCFLKYLFHNFPFKGPMLVCVPLSTVAAWQKELSQWAPDMNTVTYLGDAKSRDVIREFECENEDGELSFNVLLCSYEMVCRDRDFFQDIIWSNIVVDEAHRLKNEESLLYKVLTDIDSHHRLLLTGTPLQNNLKELWCLLNYLKLSDIEDWSSFEQQYGKPEDVANGYIGLHTLLKPYIIRRLKKDVEKSLPPKVEQILRVEMTRKQKNMYKMVLTKNYHFLSKGGKSQVSLVNIMMQLRKTTNHVELIHEPDPDEQISPEERLKNLNNGSGKMLLLDKLLTRFRAMGDRVLIFSQMVIMLNLIEEYLQLKRFPYQRLDGSVNSEKRKQAIASFNAPESADFCFLLSTKAGGLGINLQTANRVIIYDSDFNPQNDLQAIARAHRIGQKEEVKIFRLVASSSVDEDIIQKAKNKMVLDHLVIQNMDTTGNAVISGKKDKTSVSSLSKDELNTIIKFGAADLFKETEEVGDEGDELDLDAILSKAETREDVEAPISEANQELLSAFKCTNLRLEEVAEETEEIDKKKEVSENWEDIIPEDLRTEYKPRQEFDGLELVSDTEDLYNSIANRKKKRIKKKVVSVSDFEDDDKGSDYEARESSLSDQDGEETDQALTEEDRRIRTFLRRQQALKNNPVSTYRCLEADCSKKYAEKRTLKRHILEKHKLENFEITRQNYHNLPDIQSTDMVCQLCRRNFKEFEYKVHINLYHGGVEPEINYDHNMLRDFKRYQAKQNLQNEAQHLKKNVICLTCSRCFSDAQHLRRHVTSVHGVSRSEFEVTEENFLNLPAAESPILRCFACSLNFSTALSYKVHILHKHDGVEPTGNIDSKNIAEYEEQTKILICTTCQERFSSHATLRSHMGTCHDIEDYQIQEENYHNLPSVKSELNRCLPCKKQFAKTFLYRLHIKSVHGSEEPSVNYLDLVRPMKLTKEDYQELPSVESEHNRCVPCNLSLHNTLRYRIHVKEAHAGQEPKENLDPANFSQAADLVCLICTKKYKEGRLLKSHILRSHIGLEEDTEKKEVIEVETSAEDPLADPLADVEIDPLSSCKTDTDTSADCDNIEIKDVEHIKASAEINISLNHSPKPVTIPLKPRQLTSGDKVLVEEMLNRLRKYGCAFCLARFDTKSTLSVHEKAHLKARAIEKPKVIKAKKEKKKPAPGPGEPGYVEKKARMKTCSVGQHDVTDGPVCPRCEAVCKDSAHFRNHLLSHYYRAFDGHIPASKPFECPDCHKPSRDKITLIRHFAFTHQKLFELTDLKPEDLNPKGSAKVRGNYSRKVNGALPVIGEKTEKSVPSEAEKVSRDKENNEVRVSIETPKEEDESLGGGFTDTK